MHDTNLEAQLKISAGTKPSASVTINPGCAQLGTSESRVGSNPEWGRV
jgi:hypothetical protein